MTVYRVQVTHVGWWRGAPHRWHSTLHYSISTDAQAAGTISDLYAKLQPMGSSTFPGGIAEIAIYNTATGGVPIASQVYFNWADSATWIPYTGTGWAVAGASQPVNGEAAAHFRTQAGLSRTGKPVYVGLYWHSFQAQADNAAAVQFTAPVVTALAARYNALQAIQAGGVAVGVQVTPSGASIAGTGTLLPYVVSHQRTRGRRRRLTGSASQSASIIQGAIKGIESVVGPADTGFPAGG